MGPNKIGVQKYVGPETFWVLKTFWSKQNVGLSLAGATDRGGQLAWRSCLCLLESYTVTQSNSYTVSQIE